MMENGSHAFIRDVGTVDLKLSSRKIVQLKNMHYVPSINKNLVSDSLLCRDGLKVVLESNKFIVSKCGQFIGKDYVCRGLFHFLVSDFCNKAMNNIYDGINESDASVWHSCLCHLLTRYGVDREHAAPTRYRVIKIVRSCSEVVLRTIKN
jgi:hypothetical protein